MGYGNARSLLLHPLVVHFLMPSEHRHACRVGSAQPAGLLAVYWLHPPVPPRVPSRRCFFPGSSQSAGLAGSPEPAQVGHGQLPGADGLQPCPIKAESKPARVG